MRCATSAASNSPGPRIAGHAACMNRRLNLRAITLTVIVTSWAGGFAFLSLTVSSTIQASTPAWSGTP